MCPFSFLTSTIAYQSSRFLWRQTKHEPYVHTQKYFVLSYPLHLEKPGITVCEAASMMGSLFGQKNQHGNLQQK